MNISDERLEAVLHSTLLKVERSVGSEELARALRVAGVNVTAHRVNTACLTSKRIEGSEIKYKNPTPGRYYHGWVAKKEETT